MKQKPPRMEEDIELVPSKQSLGSAASSDQDEELDPDRAQSEALLHTAVSSSTPSLESCRRARRLLYVSHAFAQFSDFAWIFTITVFLAAIANHQSLLLVSSYGFATQLAVCLVCPILGKWLDDAHTHRLRAAQRLVGWENVSVWMTTISCFLLVRSLQEDTWDSDGVHVQEGSHGNSTILASNSQQTTSFSNPEVMVGLALIHFFGSVARVLDQAFTVAMERDWVVEMSQATANASHEELTVNHSLAASDSCSNHTTWPSIDSTFQQCLTEMNVTMRQIDLSCKVIGPAVAGLLLPLVSSKVSSDTPAGGLEWGCLFVGCLNTVSLLVEYLCTYKIYHLVPSLSATDRPNKKTCDPEVSGGPTVSWADGCFCRELQMYWRQPVSGHGLSLALLYCNG